MVRPLAGLAIGLEAVSQIAQKIGHHIVTNTMAKFTKPGCQVAQALGRPQQRRRRIAARRRLHQVLEIGEQRWIRDDQRPASAALPADPIERRVGLCLAAQLRQSASIVLRAIPVIRATAVTPPRPAASASAAANRRRPRSSSTGPSAA